MSRDRYVGNFGLVAYWIDCEVRYAFSWTFCEVSQLSQRSSKLIPTIRAFDFYRLHLSILKRNLSDIFDRRNHNRFFLHDLLRPTHAHVPIPLRFNIYLAPNIISLFWFNFWVLAWKLCLMDEKKFFLLARSGFLLFLCVPISQQTNIRFSPTVLHLKSIDLLDLHSAEANFSLKFYLCFSKVRVVWGSSEWHAPRGWEVQPTSRSVECIQRHEHIVHARHIGCWLPCSLWLSPSISL